MREKISLHKQPKQKIQPRFTEVVGDNKNDELTSSLPSDVEDNDMRIVESKSDNPINIKGKHQITTIRYIGKCMLFFILLTILNEISYCRRQLLDWSMQHGQ